MYTPKYKGMLLKNTYTYIVYYNILCIFNISYHMIYENGILLYRYNTLNVVLIFYIYIYIYIYIYKLTSTIKMITSKY